MKRITWIAVVVLSFAVVLMVLRMATVSRGQVNDDYAIISQMTTLTERQEFFRSLTPERKSALWRKHYTTELTKHPELTPDQKAVVDLAVVMASSDLYTEKLTEQLKHDIVARGSVFGTALERAFKDVPTLRVEIFGVLGGPMPKPVQQENPRHK